MKKITFFLMCIVVNLAYLNAQVFSGSSSGSGVHCATLPNSQYLFPKKILRYNDSTHIALYSTYRQGWRFCMLSNSINGDSLSFVSIPNYLNIHDFAILDDNLYFCGNVNNYPNIVAFVAYIGINELFNLPNSVYSDIKYTLFDNIDQDSIFSINRIEAFYDTCGHPTIVGIGTMLYGTPPYNLFTPETGNQTIMYPDTYHLDFLMLYTVDEHQALTNQNAVNVGGATPIYQDANSVKMYYLPSDTVQGVYYNRFQDIVLTDDYICIAGIERSYSLLNENYTSKAITLRRFNKNTMQQKSCTLILPYYIKYEYGFNIAHTGANTLAIASVELDSVSERTITSTLKVNIGTQNNFQINIHSKFDNQQYKSSLKDCKYLPSTNKLLVLRNSLDTPNGFPIDRVFEVKMSNSIYPYTLKKFDIRGLNGDTVSWNSISISNSTHYTLNGYCYRNAQNKFLYFFDKNTTQNTSSTCYTNANHTIIAGTNVGISSCDELQPCYFPDKRIWIIDEGNGYQSLFTWHGRKLVYDALIETISFPTPFFGVPNTICEY